MTRTLHERTGAARDAMAIALLLALAAPLLLVNLGNPAAFKNQIADSRGCRHHENSFVYFEQAARDFGNASGAKVLILVTDGKEECGGSPTQVVEELTAAGFEFEVNSSI